MILVCYIANALLCLATTCRLVQSFDTRIANPDGEAHIKGQGRWAMVKNEMWGLELNSTFERGKIEPNENIDSQQKGSN